MGRSLNCGYFTYPTYLTSWRSVRMREPGMWQQRYVDRVAVLEAQLDTAAVEHFSLPNDGGRSITEVGEEILKRTGWLVP